ncbi:MAG: hypothetical protein WCG87_01580 [Bacteroidota bacterium]
MEKRNREILQQRYTITKKIILLDIPNEYQYMDEELIGMIQRCVQAYISG